MSQSEIAQLRRRIELETLALHRGLYGLAACARHEVITHKYQSIDQHRQQLAKIVGVEQSYRIVLGIQNDQQDEES